MCKLCSIDQNLILLESEYSILLANYYPIGFLSLLAIPKRHVYSITDLTIDEANDLTEMVRFGFNNIKSQINPHALNAFFNEGEIAGQTIPHLHWHIVARMENDGLENFKRNGEPTVITEEQLTLAKKCF